MADIATARLTTGRVVDIVIPLLLLALLIALCVQLLVPFVGLLIWTIIFAVCFYPVHKKLRTKMSNRMSAIVIGVGLSALVLVPTTIASISAAGSIPKVVAAIQTGEQQIPPPPARLQTLPVVGEKAFAARGRTPPPTCRALQRSTRRSSPPSQRDWSALPAASS